MFTDPRSILARHGVYAKKRYSQNFLIAPSVVDAMAADAKGTVLEIGPGVGTLTNALASRAKRVIAIEQDPEMVRILRAEYQWENVEIIEADALAIELPPFDRCIASVPYAISSPLLFKLLPLEYESLTLLLQREFCQKLLMQGTPSRLSIMAYSYADTELVRNVKRTAFHPPPAVDSMVVRIVPNRKVTIDATYEAVVTALFTHKKKTVRNALVDGREIFNKGKEEINAIAAGAPYAAERVTTLDVYRLREIADYLSARLKEGAT